MDQMIKRIKLLTNRLNQYRYEYYTQNAPTVSDEVYDRLFDELAALEAESGIILSDSPTHTVGYTTIDGFSKVSHPVPLLSLDKTKQISELLSFIVGRPVMIMLKLDGLTVKLEYKSGRLVRASTRGDGHEGEDITHNIPAFKNVPLVIPYQKDLTITGEAFIHRHDFEALKNTITDSSGMPYRNARNMAAGSVRCLSAEKCAQRSIHFIPFGVLEGLDETTLTATRKSAQLAELDYLGFGHCDLFVYNDSDLLVLTPPAQKQELENKIEFLKTRAQEQGLPIDGIVATYDDIAYAKSCGQTGHHYKNGLAFKFEDELYGTSLLSIEWTPTRSGEISPVAVFEPVEIDGCEVSRASLHNLTFIKELELMPDCRILVSKRNMIIPHVEENLDRGRFDAGYMFPTYCPCCGTSTRIHTTIMKVRINGEIVDRKVETLHCDNPACTMQRLRQFVHFVSKKAMNIEGLSEATLEKLIGRGWLHSFMDIYRLDEHADEIIRMEGFGEKSWTRLWDAIQQSRNTTFERYLISMDIPMIGRTASKELSRVFSGDLLAFELAVDMGYDFTDLADFGETLHRNIHDWFRNEENRNLWEELQKMMNIQKNTVAAEVKGNPFTGLTIVVTGKLELFTRNSINAKIEELGAKAGSAVSKNTDYLICGENAGSKLDKARELGVPVLTEQQFLNMAENGASSNEDAQTIGGHMVRHMIGLYERNNK